MTVHLNAGKTFYFLKTFTSSFDVSRDWGYKEADSKCTTSIKTKRTFAYLVKISEEFNCQANDSCTYVIKHSSNLIKRCPEELNRAFFSEYNILRKRKDDINNYLVD